MKKASPQRILGLDPGFASLGWGMIEKDNHTLKCLAYGCIRTLPTSTFPERLLQLHHELLHLFTTFEPELVSIEKLYFATNAKTAIDVSQARGILVLTAALHEKTILEFTPLQVKQSVTGFGKADKYQVQNMVQRILKLTKTPHPDDAADALAVAICASNSFQPLS